MKEYLEIVDEVLRRGLYKENRTGIPTISCFGIHKNIKLKGSFPLLTTKKMSWKNIVVELLWFLSGSTDITLLHKHNCHFWDHWVDKDGRVPMAYGHYWRNFPTLHFDSNTWSHGELWRKRNNDQIRFIIDMLKTNPNSRRMVCTPWYPEVAQQASLPPCHCMFIVNVQPKVRAHWGETEPSLCLHLTQRSCDVALGVPYNIASYALLAHLLAHLTKIQPGVFSYTLVDAHIYTSHIDNGSNAYELMKHIDSIDPYDSENPSSDHVAGLEEQMRRQPSPIGPYLKIDDSIQTLEDVECLITEATTKEILEVFKLTHYDPAPAIKFKVAI